MTINLKHAKRVFEAARKNKRIFVEALWSRWPPSYQHIMKEIESGTLGDIRLVQANFCVSILFIHRMSTASLGGGAAIEIGIYPLNLACMVLKEMPESIAAVGQLSEAGAQSYKETISKTRCLITELQNEGVQNEISWTPGHANIAGNEIADRLAKEATTEADTCDETNTPTSLCDIKTAAKKSCEIKWQNRWSQADTGRHLFQYAPEIPIRTPYLVNIPPQSQRVIHQLRTGYCMLNQYRHSISLSDTPLCQCGQVESVDHYIEDCSIYDVTRERLRSELCAKAGIVDFSSQMLLVKKKKMNGKNGEML